MAHVDLYSEALVSAHFKQVGGLHLTPDVHSKTLACACCSPSSPTCLPLIASYMSPVPQIIVNHYSRALTRFFPVPLNSLLFRSYRECTTSTHREWCTETSRSTTSCSESAKYDMTLYLLPSESSLPYFLSPSCQLVLSFNLISVHHRHYQLRVHHIITGCGIADRGEDR